MNIQPIKSFANFVDKTGSKTIGLCKGAKSKADGINANVKSFVKAQADKFVATKPAQFVGKNKNVIVGDKFRIMNSEILNKEVAKYNEVIKGFGRIMIRASGTEPKIRVMVESKDQKLNEEISESLVNTVKQIDGEF